MTTIDTLGICGIIGAGKTTLGAALAKAGNYHLIAEPLEENKFLPLFYGPGGMKKWAFAMQMFILRTRAAEQQRAMACYARTIQDRTVHEDAIFARLHHKAGNISDGEYARYTTAYDAVRRMTRTPDMLLYLDVLPETALIRIGARMEIYPTTRACEASIDLGYLRALKLEYDEFREQISRTVPVVTLDWEHPWTTAQVIAEINRHAPRSV
jgi:deoxyadenosine/deoxycytidine kinase